MPEGKQNTLSPLVTPRVDPISPCGKDGGTQFHLSGRGSGCLNVNQLEDEAPPPAATQSTKHFKTAGGCGGGVVWRWEWWWWFWCVGGGGGCCKTSKATETTCGWVVRWLTNRSTSLVPIQPSPPTLVMTCLCTILLACLKRS